MNPTKYREALDFILGLDGKGRGEVRHEIANTTFISKRA